MKATDIAARIRKDAELMRIIHITDEEALVLANHIAPMPKAKPKKEPFTVCGAYIPGHHCSLSRGHKGPCEE